MAGDHRDPPERSTGSTVVHSIGDQPTSTVGGGVVDATLLAGTRLGPYVVIRLLGKGGMGAVYECEDRESGRRLAVKTLGRADWSGSSRARFLREGRMAAALSHPSTVYVFGSDEIDGVPIIAMELVAGGTLSDRVRQHGPMAVRDAIRAIRQVVDGLAAAADQGILHRDVKPANCFVDAAGAVKIGDFGLSVSAERGIETMLTTAQTFLGTPAFASPEQLRGDDLDSRSDMYAVGATLYYLLSGHAPFEDSNFIKLVSQVSSEPPKPIQQWRPDIADGLAAVIEKCLAKKPADRYADYAALGAALEPFAHAHEPARVIPRLVAFVADRMIATLPMVASLQEHFVDGFRRGVEGAGPGPSTALTAPQLFLEAFLIFVYFSVLEGRWGVTAGKAVFGLRVVGPHGGVPGFQAAAARAAMVAGLDLVAGLAVFALPLEAFSLSAAQTAFQVLAMIWLMSAGRPFGRVGWHDRLTDTAVVRTAIREATPNAFVPSAVERQPGDRSVGPYRVVADEGEVANGMLRGFDPRLRREVWLRVVPVGTPPISAARRDLSRPSRQRWMGGRRGASEGDNWDAFEAIDGVPIARALESPVPWEILRRALATLTGEIAAARADATDLFQHLDDVWLTRRGEIKIAEPASHGGGDATAIAVIAGVAARAARLHPPPLHVTATIQQLAAGAITPSAAAMALADARPSRVTSRKRLQSLALATLLPILMTVTMVATAPIYVRTAGGDPTIAAFRQHLRILEAVTERYPEMSEERRALEVVLVGRYRDTALLPPGVLSMINVGRLAAAKQLVESRQQPDEAGLRAAEAVIAPLLAHPERVRVGPPPQMAAIALLISLLAWMLASAVGIVTGLAMRSGLSLRATDLAVVDATGAPAGRLRAGLRAVVTWLPVLAAGGIFVYDAMGPARFTGGPTFWAWLSVAVMGAALIAGGVKAVLSPMRGWQDRIAGTWVVPK